MSIIKNLEQGVYFAGEILEGWLSIALSFKGVFAVVGLGFLTCVIIRLVVRGLD